MDPITEYVNRFDQLGAWAHTLLGLAAGLLAATITAILAQVVVAVAERLVRGTSTTRDDALLHRVRRPLGLFAPVVGLHATGAWLGWGWVVGVAELGEGLLLTYVLVASFEILVLESWLESRQGIRVPAPVRQLIITVIYGAVLLGIAGDAFGFDVTPLLATGSVTTVVLGLALQGPLSNLFAGIVLHVENHPRPGEWVLIDGREGEIVEIGWRTTRMRTFTDDVVAVPNAVLLNAQVVNFTTPTPLHGRTIPVPVPLDLPPHVFDRWVRDCLATIPHVVEVESTRTKTWLVAIDDHCQRYQVRFWVDHFRFHDDAESELLKRLWYRFTEEGVAFPAAFQAVRVVDGGGVGWRGWIRSGRWVDFRLDRSEGRGWGCQGEAFRGSGRRRGAQRDSQSLAVKFEWGRGENQVERSPLTRRVMPCFMLFTLKFSSSPTGRPEKRR